MTTKRYRIATSTGLWLGALLCASAGDAAAQEYCVACTEPAGQYRCVIDGAQPNGGQPLQMLCVTAMARAGNHATCSVKRGTVFDCDGPVRHVPWAALTPAPSPAAQPPPPVTPQPPQPDPATAAKPAPEAPPQTVVEMAKRANEQTAKDMKQAGDKMKDGVNSMGEAIGSATKKSWDCMVSFFTRC